MYGVRARGQLVFVTYIYVYQIFMIWFYIFPFKSFQLIFNALSGPIVHLPSSAYYSDLWHGKNFSIKTFRKQFRERKRRGKRENIREIIKSFWRIDWWLAYQRNRYIRSEYKICDIGHSTFDIRYQHRLIVEVISQSIWMYHYRISTSNCKVVNWNDIIRNWSDIYQPHSPLSWDILPWNISVIIRYLFFILHLISCLALYFFLSIRFIHFLSWSRHNLLLLLLWNIQRASFSILRKLNHKSGTVHQLLFSILKTIVFVLSFPVLWKGLSWYLLEMITLWHYFSDDNFIEYWILNNAWKGNENGLQCKFYSKYWNWRFDLVLKVLKNNIEENFKFRRIVRKVCWMNKKFIENRLDASIH